MLNYKKYKIVLIGIIVLLFILSLIYIFSSLTKTKNKVNIQENISVTDTTPTEGSTNFSVFDPIIVAFDKDVDSSLIAISSDPSEDWTVKNEVRNIVNLKSRLFLRAGTNYKISISYNGSVIKNLSFSTAQEQNNPRQLQIFQTEIDRDYPAAKLTPYITTDYKVVYIEPLTLEIEIKSNIQDQDAIFQVKSWLKLNNIDPNSHKYTIKK